MATAWFNAMDKMALSFFLYARVGRKARQQNRLETEREGERGRKEKKGRESTLASLPFHSIKYAPGQTDIWVTLHSLKRGSMFLTTTPPPPPSPSPVTHKLPNPNVSPSLYQTSPLSANSWALTRSGSQTLEPLVCVLVCVRTCVCVCVCV